MTEEKEETEKESSEGEETEEKESAVIQAVKKYIEENYQRTDLKISDAAEQVYLSTTYLSSLFKAKTGMTVGQYITKCRVEKAKELLPAFVLQRTDTAHSGMCAQFLAQAAFCRNPSARSTE